ncbi:hypothetical protein ACFLZM_04605 [Thermodesulfobacteriota bacterium]
MLAILGLEIHPDKTRIVHAQKGFDFLGMHLRLRPVREKGIMVKRVLQDMA